ncbi:WD repeat-containing protein 27 [Phytophthora pseudosyringae]|uniref:WD repeat-containing protein 27 n=1 Tax=Phytophthora pseudosyringae TaxID=221518 RepID=A0A8T1WI53_9STRA|nr:WD repeat-containing protein 27 [Phytophthora pseudosyringae]
MELLAGAAWQWRPKATLTAADTCDRCTVFALQYSDCAVLRVRWNDNAPTSSRFVDPQTNSEPLDRDLELHGHAERVVCVKIYDKDPSVVTVCSASRDCVIVWRVPRRSPVTQTILVEDLPAEPGWVTFDETGTLVAVASERDVKILVIERIEVLVTLEGHLARVTRGEFHPTHHHLLVTASEDRTFKIWDLAARALWFQSTVLSAFSILSVALNPVNGDAAFGFADGSVKVFALLDGYAKELTAFNVENYVRKALRRKQESEREARREKPQVISSLPPWARSQNAQRSTTSVGAIASYGSVDRPGQSDLNDEDEINVDVSCPVLSMKYVCADRTVPKFSTSTKAQQFSSHQDRELLDYKQFLVVGVPGYLLSVNAYSFEIGIVHDFQQSLERTRQPLDPICVAKDFCLYHPPRSDNLHCGVISAFQPCFTMLNIATPSSDTSWQSTGNQAEVSAISAYQISLTEERPACHDNNERVSVIPQGPPPKDSVLNVPPLSAMKTPPKGAKSLDKPVAFHTRIKSSGYGSSSTPFAARRTPPKSRSKARKSLADSRAKGSSTSVDSYLKEYPTNCGLLQHYQPKHALPPKTLHQGAILHIEYSGDAKWLATSGNDRVAQVCKLPFSRFGGEGNVFVGHDQAVRAIHWSQNDRTLVTVGSDKTSRLWLLDSDTSSLTLQGIAPPSSMAAAAAAMGSMSSAKKATRQEIVEARFFYMDKFLLSACGNLARLHQFELDEVYARASSSKAKPTKKKNDIEVLENQSRKKRVAQWSFDDMQSVTSLACMNGAFLSSVAVIAGSDRSLRVLDVGAGGGGRTVRVVRDAHSRAAHTVALPRPTCYASHPSNFYDLLLSSATDSTTHLWDIRADNCVMRFGEHVNRVHTLGVAFSPCMRYVATGSEDRAAYIYDIRTGRRLVKLIGHTDVVTSVAFSPLHPQLATASCDGTVRFYSSEASE